MYDVIIIGGGPAGLSAALYAARGGLTTLLLEAGLNGGQIAVSDVIENYPGQAALSEQGSDLTNRMKDQALSFGAEYRQEIVTELSLEGDVKTVTTLKNKYETRTVILATGAAHRPIGCLREAEFIGKGVSYCATCDGFFFRKKDVYVVGGGDAAVEEAVFLTKFARHVTIIHRRDRLRAAQAVQDKAFSNEKISFLWNTVVEELGGEEKLTTMILKDTVTGERFTVEADPDDGVFGLFGFVGMLPKNELFADTVALDNGYVDAGEDTHTSVPGVFAAGDVRKKAHRQVVTAAADGAVAALEAEKYIQEKTY